MDDEELTLPSSHEEDHATMASGSPGGPTLQPQAGLSSSSNTFGGPAKEAPKEISATTQLKVGATIAQGGMGAILEANDPALDRTVAMKVMLPDADASEGARQRFVREALVLARLEHPNIVPIHEVGKDEHDRPFYTMKLVKGRTLQDVLSQIEEGDEVAIGEFSLNRLLDIFRQVCDAIAFAHHQGVIHRDIKPENIMIGKFGETLVMDWGLARFFDGPVNPPAANAVPETSAADSSGSQENSRVFQDLLITDASSDLTIEGAIMGSPKYMAPEQAEGRVIDMDHRSDVYALGALLYALLTLRAPVSGDSVKEVLEKVKSGKITPPTSLNPGSRPDAAVSRAVPVVSPDALPTLPHCPGGRVPEALSAVVMRALELKPKDRYQQVALLAKDIAAYQGGFATSAESLGLLRLAALFYRRNRVAVVAALVASLAVLIGLAFSIAMFLRERTAREQADLQTERSREVAQFLKDTLAAVGPSVAMGRDTAMMRDILDQTAERIGELRERSAISAELRQVIGNAYTELRVFEPALTNLHEALRVQRELHVEDHPDLATTILDYATGLEMAGQVKEAEPFAREALAMWRRLDGPDSIPAANSETLVGWLMIKLGRPKDGLAMAKHAMKIWRQHPADKSLAEAPNTLATLFQQAGDNLAAAKIYAEELATQRKIHGREHPLIANTLDNYGTQLIRVGRYDEAETLLLEALPMGRKFFGERSPDEDHILSGLARIAGIRGDLEAQLDYARQAIAVGARVYPVGHRYWRDCHGQYLATVISQIEKNLQRARKTRGSIGKWEAELERAGRLLSELEQVLNLKILTKAERPWLNCLAAALAHIKSPDDVAIRRSLTGAINKVNSIKSPSDTWKKRSQVANEFLIVPAVKN